MQGNKKDLRTADADDQPDVRLSFEKMLADIAPSFLPDLQEGDITKAVIAQRFGCSIKVAAYRADKMVESGKWRVVQKKSDDGHVVNVYVQK